SVYSASWRAARVRRPTSSASRQTGSSSSARASSSESPAAALQDRRAPHSACPVLHPAAGRKSLDEDPLSADSGVHRATRMGPHVIEKAGPGGREKRSTLGGSISRPDGRRGQTFGRWAVSLAGAAGTAHDFHSSSFDET